LLQCQAIDPDGERIAAPRIQRKSKATDMAEVDQARLRSAPLGVCRQRDTDRHPSPARLAERQVGEQVPALGWFQLDGSVAAIKPEHRTGILESRKIWIGGLDPEADRSYPRKIPIGIAPARINGGGVQSGIRSRRESERVGSDHRV